MRLRCTKDCKNALYLAISSTLSSIAQAKSTKVKTVYNILMPSISPHDRIEPAEMTSLLKQALPETHLRLLHLIAEAAVERGLSLYIIGGFVRDLFLGHASLDFDLVTGGDAVAFARHICRNYGGKVTVHSQFGTASWCPDLEKLTILNGASLKHVKMEPLDFVTARSETYPHPGALPEVKAGSLSDDLQRRDFIINTLALRLDGEHFGELYDPLGGLEDIENKQVRVLHPESYLDDPTRILRAVRYEQRYGFEIAPADLLMIAEAKGRLGSLSGERLRHELDLILAEQKSAAMMDRLAALDIVSHIHPLLQWDESISTLLHGLDKPEPDFCVDIPDLLHISRRVGLSYLLWLGRLPTTAIQELARRFDFTVRLREALLDLTSLFADLPGLIGKKPSEVVARLDGIPLLVVYAAWLTEGDPTRQILENYLSRWRHIHQKTTGNDLVKHGLAPGPAYREILWILRSAWLNGDLNSEAEEMSLLEKLIKEKQKPS
jgi:tRNA nucleotidyltransferase (CCA-adding enzyme)